MSGSKTDEVVSKKTISKSTPKTESSPTKSSTEPEGSVSKKKTKSKKKTPVDGVELARLRRLKRWGCPVDKCALLGIPLNVGPRSDQWHQPRLWGEEWVSVLALIIIEANVPPKALDLAAKCLIKRGDQ